MLPRKKVEARPRSSSGGLPQFVVGSRVSARTFPWRRYAMTVTVCAAILLLSDVIGLNKHQHRHLQDHQPHDGSGGVHLEQQADVNQVQGAREILIAEPHTSDAMSASKEGSLEEAVSADPAAGASDGHGSATLAAPDKDTPLASRNVAIDETAVPLTQPREVSGSDAYRYEKAGLAWAPQGVVYRGTPWKPAVGEWMRTCDGHAADVEIIEVRACARLRSLTAASLLPSCSEAHGSSFSQACLCSPLHTFPRPSLRTCTAL